MLVLSGLIAVWDWVRLGLVHSSPISHEAVTTFLTTHFGIIHGSASSGLVFFVQCSLGTEYKFGTTGSHSDPSKSGSGACGGRPRRDRLFDVAQLE